MSEPGQRPRERLATALLKKRFAVAVAASVLLHLLVAIWARPNYRDVRDHAGLSSIVELGVEPGRRPAAAPPAPEPAAPPVPAPAPKAKVAPPPTPKAESAVTVPRADTDTPTTDRGTDSATDTSPDTATSLAAASADSGAGTSSETGVSGTDSSQGEALCLHDLFAFSGQKPQWALWLSLASLRGTVFEADVARALRAFAYTRELEAVTGLDPGTDIEGLLVTAKDVNDWKTFETVVTYDTGEERLRSHLTRALSARPGFVVVSTPSGWELNVPGEQRYHLLGAGRVLLTAAAAPADAARHSSHGEAPAWPKQVECLAPSRVVEGTDPSPRSPLVFDAAAAEVSLLQSALRPLLFADEDGRFPVLAMATTDPRAMGLRRGERRSGLVVRGAALRGYFGETVRIEAFVGVTGEEAAIVALGKAWKARIAASAADPFLKMTGLAGTLPRIEVEPRDNGVRVSVELSPGEVRAALVFLQMQGEVLDRHSAQ